MNCILMMIKILHAWMNSLFIVIINKNFIIRSAIIFLIQTVVKNFLRLFLLIPIHHCYFY